MSSCLSVGADYLFTERIAVVYIDGIFSAPFKAVNHSATSVSELSLHYVEDMLANTKPPDQFVFIEMRIVVAGLVGVTKKDLKQYQAVIRRLLHSLHSA